MDPSDLLGLGGFFLVNFATASSGAIFTPGPWYEKLQKPSWCPPKWAFPVVWTLLFIAIAISGWMVWRVAGLTGAMIPLALYALQLLLNATWSAIFFGLKRPDLAFYEMCAFWLAIAATIWAFYGVSPNAALLLTPYLLWVTIAGFLNASIWRLNGGAPQFGTASAA